jgi:hypothetical protein
MARFAFCRPLTAVEAAPAPIPAALRRIISADAAPMGRTRSGGTHRDVCRPQTRQSSPTGPCVPTALQSWITQSTTVPCMPPPRLDSSLYRGRLIQLARFGFAPQ